MKSNKNEVSQEFIDELEELLVQVRKDKEIINKIDNDIEAFKAQLAAIEFKIK